MDLVAKLLLKSKNFEDNIKKAKGSVDDFKSSTDRTKQSFKESERAAKSYGQTTKKSIVEATREMKKQRQQMEKLQKQIKSAKATFATFTGITVGLKLVSDAFSYNIETAKNFESALSSLRSLTGVSTEELTYFREEAIRLGGTSTQTASQVVDAFKLIGSQKPELLKNKEALVDVTSAAITLAEAAQIEVPEAAKALTGSLNQMGVSADHASEFINILAAASKEGAADIPYLNQAIEKSGGTASSVGIKFNELVAAIEAIAPKVSDAGSAGTYLRNIFLILESSADQKLKPSIVGLNGALQNLASMQMNATQLTKMFGKENVTAAIALINAKDECQRLTTAITGTSTAYDQAKINNDNFQGSLKQLGSAWEALNLTINTSNGWLRDFIDLCTKAVQAVNDLAGADWNLSKAKFAKAMKDQKAPYLKQIDDLKQKFKEGKISQKEFEQGMNQIKDSLYQLGNDLQSGAKVMKIGEWILQPHQKKEAIKQFHDLGNEVMNEYYSTIEAKRKDFVAQHSTKPDVKTDQPEPTKTPKTDIAPKGSIKWYQDQIAEATKAFNNATTDKARETLQIKINELKNALALIQKQSVNVNNSPEGQSQLLLNYETEARSLEAQIAVEVDSTKVEELDQRLNYVLEKISQLKGQGVTIDVALNLEEFEEDGIEIPEIDDKEARLIGINNQIDLLNEKTRQTNLELQSMSSVLSSCGEAFQIMGGDAGDALSFVCDSLATVANGVQEYMSIQAAATQAQLAQSAAKTSASSVEAVAAGTASASEMPFPYNLAAIAAVVATIVSVIASAKSKFANGGIVGGSSYSGDNLSVRVNSGEMILNKRQQGNLFKMINDGTGVDSSNGNVHFRIEGKDLVGVLSNYNSKRSKLL